MRREQAAFQWKDAPPNAPARLIEGGLPAEATPAHVLVSKYADHLPLHRQAQILARSGVDLDRSTLAAWGEIRSRSDRTVQRTARRIERAQRRTARLRSTSAPSSSGWPRR